MTKNPFAKRGLFSAVYLAAAVFTAGAARKPRPLPAALAGHPGNIFTAGEEVIVSVPDRAGRWNLRDDEGRVVSEVPPQAGRVALGKLGVGWYRLQPTGGGDWISLGVLQPLRAPTPMTSPIAVDVAMAWFYPPDRMDAVASLCALAGVNWVRDRLSWPEMEPAPGRLAGSNKYDASAAAQARAGLRVLQVIHASPAWANPNGKRFPTDLRDAYRFFESMARRWKGQVAAFEPWNEADIPMFGGHTGAEMAALQKASYLGLKAGAPEIVACLNVWAHHNTNQLSDLHDNQAWPYFDTYNLHHYEAFDRFPALYADHRAVSAGRPLWVSECAMPVKWAGDEKLKEPTDADLRVQAERVARTFAGSLHEGSAATFYFLLPHYVEGPTQFGIVRPDLTPRPAFVALAAAGRLLAGARPLGRWRTDDAAVRAFLFQARPDGRDSAVLVAWATNGSARLRLPVKPREAYDYLGRPREITGELALGHAPVFALLPSDAAQRLPLNPPPATPSFLDGQPSPVVFQTLWSDDQLDLKRSAYRLPAGSVRVPLFAYNLGSKATRGSLRLIAPAGWTLAAPAKLELAPMERQELALTRTTAPAPSPSPEVIRVEGDFGRAARPVLSVRILPASQP